MVRRVALAVVVVLFAACGDDAGPVFTTSTTTSATTSTTAAASSSSAPTTTTTTTSTTAAPSTTSGPIPGQVLGLVVSLGGGSEEVSVVWDFNPEPFVDHYAVYYSPTADGAFGFQRDVADDSASPIPGHPGYVDYPRAQTVGMTCYRVGAVSAGGVEGPLSDISCFDPEPGPPSQVQDVVVGLGGGSGEVAVTWQASPESDVDYYDVYFSATPGGSYAYTRSVHDDSASPIPGRPGFIDYPRDQTVGMTCYRVRAVDHDLNSGLLSVESCFQP